MNKKVKFVWDTSAIINIKEPNESGYSPAHSLFKDLNEGWLGLDYLNIFPALAVFEVEATVSRMLRENKKILRDFYIVDDNSILYDIDEELLLRSQDLFDKPGFSNLRGADLVFACIAYIEDAYLVTMDKQFKKDVSEWIKILDLNKSRITSNYREYLEDNLRS